MKKLISILLAMVVLAASTCWADKTMATNKVLKAYRSDTGLIVGVNGPVELQVEIESIIGRLNTETNCSPSTCFVEFSKNSEERAGDEYIVFWQKKGHVKIGVGHKASLLARLQIIPEIGYALISIELQRKNWKSEIDEEDDE